MKTQSFNLLKSLLSIPGRTFRLSILLCLALSLYACKGSQKTPRGKRAKKISKKELLKKVESNEFAYQTLSIKGKGSFEDVSKNDRFTFTYRLRMASDSLIWLNITKFNIPALSSLMDQDSIRLRRIDTKEAIFCDYELFRSMSGIRLPANLSLVEHILLGNPYLVKNVDMENGTKNVYRLKGNYSGYGLKYDFSPSDFKLQQMEITDAVLGINTKLQYSNFEDYAGKRLPGKTTIIVDGTSQTRLELEHSRVEIDEETNFVFRIPKSYEKKYCNTLGNNNND